MAKEEKKHCSANLQFSSSPITSALAHSHIPLDRPKPGELSKIKADAGGKEVHVHKGFLLSGQEKIRHNGGRTTLLSVRGIFP